MSELIISKRAIVRAELGERIELPGRQYVPYVAVAGMFFCAATGAPIVALGFILLMVHAFLPTEAKPAQLNPKMRRMHVLLSEDGGDDRTTLDDLVQNSIPLNPELARSIMEFIYEKAYLDSDRDWVVLWRGQEVLVYDFFAVAFRHRNEKKHKTLFDSPVNAVKADAPKIESPSTLEDSTPKIGRNTILNAIEVPAVPAAQTADNSIEVLVKEFPEWVKPWANRVVERDAEGKPLRMHYEHIQDLWMLSHQGRSFADFQTVIFRNLPSTAKRDGNYIYFGDRPSPSSAPQPYRGTEVTPQMPKVESLRDRILGKIGAGEIHLTALIASFGDEKEVVKEEFKRLVQAGVIKAGSRNGMVTING